MGKSNSAGTIILYKCEIDKIKDTKEMMKLRINFQYLEKYFNKIQSLSSLKNSLKCEEQIIIIHDIKNWMVLYIKFEIKIIIIKKKEKENNQKMASPTPIILSSDFKQKKHNIYNNNLSPLPSSYNNNDGDDDDDYGTTNT
ncbi:hypothetical protein Glove_345g21 [Diversispora epigaea]|uniref:Uncharacterized protein n=1 Tax=Diversispora epigaea TaxID=1348612 RepID=A0A397HN09_9GLOM|nr:hypothetical protein Glove_345g21 [Diversispora epigaea]